LFKKLLGSSSLLMLSNIIVAVGGLVFISLVAKKLTISEFGIFAVIQTYVLAVNSLLNFQTWYTVVKYLPRIENNKLFFSLLKYSYKLDLITAVIGTITSIVLIYFVGTILNISEYYYSIVQLFSFSILFNITGTATGYFRSINNYKIFLYSDILATTFKVLSSLICYFYFSSIEAYLIVLLLSYFIKSFYLNLLLIYDKFTQIIIADISLIRSEFSDLREYSVVTSVTSGFDVLFRQADTLLVSVFFGVQYAGIFKMIKTFMGLITQITTPIYIVLFPMVNDYVIKNKKLELKKIALHSIFLFASLGIAFFFIFVSIEDKLITSLFNSSYLQYTDYLNIYLMITLLSIIFTILHPITNLIGLHKEIMYLTIIKLILFVLLIYFLKDIYEFNGFLIAVFIETILTIVIKYIWVNRWYRK